MGNCPYFKKANDQPLHINAVEKGFAQNKRIPEQAKKNVMQAVEKNQIKLDCPPRTVSDYIQGRFVTQKPPLFIRVRSAFIRWRFSVRRVAYQPLLAPEKITNDEPTCCQGNKKSAVKSAMRCGRRCRSGLNSTPVLNKQPIVNMI